MALCLRSPDLNPLDYKIWWELEEMACQKRHPNVESLKRALVKAAAKFPMAKIRESIDDWPQRLHHCVRAKGGHFERFFCSILGILHDCNHRIYISHSVSLLLVFTFVTELMARLDISGLWYYVILPMNVGWRRVEQVSLRVQFYPKNERGIHQNNIDGDMPNLPN